ncbi:iron/cobalamin ABC transporter periplasmic substrate-binding protein [Halorubrum coriense DSM 10284]|uniref:Iron/cobalamin ABC transporter periplasmic substrate-binding protein n=1 Tax=Halorubrum coriense DSM 10284 TaxID=1227466 RepID=M0E7V8_9EURY|nr:cobalamin-binding protein [Halorubrum coriense]ELZ43916.1 iron/cobalamin ABC transporter periplasmic substrate-binding protein [Halorubrum coriense DSM 10284]
MSAPRVVSLAPSATATVAALGAADRFVGVTAHCDLPDGSAAGSAHGPDAPTAVGGWLNPDLDRVAALDPDVVLTSDALQADLATDCRDRGFDVAHREPATLDDALDGFAARGSDVGRPDAGERLAADARDRLDRIAERVAGRPRPTVYCEEWSDPPMAAGNWVPDAVRAAGGRYPFVDPGERSREVDPAAVERADPDRVVVHVCGHGDRVDPAGVAERDWIDAPVSVVDDSLLNQPSPALIDGVERLARLLHPEAFSAAADDART